MKTFSSKIRSMGLKDSTRSWITWDERCGPFVPDIKSNMKSMSKCGGCQRENIFRQKISRIYRYITTADIRDSVYANRVGMTVYFMSVRFCLVSILVSLAGAANMPQLARIKQPVPENGALPVVGL